MYLQLGVISLCATGAGVYYCVTKKIIEKKDVENCFDIIDNKLGEIENNVSNIITDLEQKFTQFVNEQIRENSPELSELEQLNPQKSTEIELTTKVSLLEESEESISSEKTKSESTEDFVLLS